MERAQRLLLYFEAWLSCCLKKADGFKQDPVIMVICSEPVSWHWTCCEVCTFFCWCRPTVLSFWSYSKRMRWRGRRWCTSPRRSWARRKCECYRAQPGTNNSMRRICALRFFYSFYQVCGCPETSSHSKCPLYSRIWFDVRFHDWFQQPGETEGLLRRSKCYTMFCAPHGCWQSFEWRSKLFPEKDNTWLVLSLLKCFRRVE